LYKEVDSVDVKANGKGIWCGVWDLRIGSTYSYVFM